MKPLASKERVVMMQSISKKGKIVFLLSLGLIILSVFVSTADARDNQVPSAGLADVAKQRANKINVNLMYAGIINAEVAGLDKKKGEVTVVFDGPVNAEKNAVGVQIPEKTKLQISFTTSGVLVPGHLTTEQKVRLHWGRYPAKKIPSGMGWAMWEIDGEKGSLIAFKTLKGLLYDPDGRGRWNFVPLALEL